MEKSNHTPETGNLMTEEINKNVLMVFLKNKKLYIMKLVTFCISLTVHCIVQYQNYEYNTSKFRLKKWHDFMVIINLTKSLSFECLTS